MAKKKRKKKILKSMAGSIEELKTLQEFGKTPPWSFIESVSTLIGKYIALQYPDGLKAEDVFIMSRLIHLSTSVRCNLDRDDIAKGMIIVNDMTNEEELTVAKSLDMLPIDFVKDKWDSIDMEEV